jgi:hypothetical protein
MINLDQLLYSLQRGQSLTERIAAAEQARLLAQGYPIDVAARLWSAAKDLIGKDCSGESRKAGFELLLSYARHDDLGYTERKGLLEVLSVPCNPDDYHFQLSVLEELTNHGNNLKLLSRRSFPCYRAGWKIVIRFPRRRGSVTRRKEARGQVGHYVRK